MNNTCDFNFFNYRTGFMLRLRKLDGVKHNLFVYTIDTYESLWGSANFIPDYRFQNLKELNKKLQLGTIRTIGV